MSYSLDDFFNGLGSVGKPNYSLEQIEAAKKRQKKKGGSFLENLEAVAAEKEDVGKNPAEKKTVGKEKPAAKGKTSGPETAGTVLSGMEQDLQRMQGALDRARAAQEAVSRASTRTTEDVAASIRELNASIARDFGTLPSGDMAMASAPKVSEAPSKETILERFQGLNASLQEKVFGQDDFLKKLVIAFKRPFVSERDHNDAMNSMYITGPACCGKHYSLSVLTKELHSRGIIGSEEIYPMDLSLYPGAAEEKIFLQDLYAALQSKAAVILFENMENCHISLLGRLSDLVATGECKLSERYVMQNGQLINVANAFAGNTIGSFEAKGKYLVFLSSKPVDKLAAVMGAPFVNALGDICVAEKLSEEAIRKIVSEEEKKLTLKCRKQLSYEVTLEESFREYLLGQTARGRGLRGVLDSYLDTVKALTELRLERDDLSTNVLTVKCVEGAPVIVAGEEEISMLSLLPSGYNGELDAVKAEMDSIVGLKEVKEYIYSLEEYFGVQKRRREAGLKAGEVNKHMIFTGNPGTGKTTIARIVSKYLKAIGVLSGGQLVEVSRADLVGRYVGHTAPLVNQVIKSAIGGVLFIDEAYSLHRGREDSFGLEAIDTLVKGIEDNRDDLIVILAGYSNEMEEFLQSNSGLKSRFPNIIDFPDYTGEELLAIARLTAKGKGYQIDEAAEAKLLAYFDFVQATRAKDAGNGRLVRNKVEEAILNQSRRLVAEPDADLSLLLEMDFELEEFGERMDG